MKLRPFEAASLLALALSLAAPRPARAAGAIGADGAPITTSAYGLDLFEGPLLSSSRVSGLSGAFAGLGEGVEGFLANAAAPALRPPWSVDWFDYDFSVGLTLPGALSQTDFDNNGTPGFAHDDFVFLTLGASLQFGRWAVGVSLDERSFRASGMDRAVDIGLSRATLLLASAFWRGQLMVGLGVRLADLDLRYVDETASGAGSETAPLFSMTGAGVQAGALWAPHALPLRVGLTGRQAVTSRAVPEIRLAADEAGDYVLRGLYLPERVELPWEIELGVAFEASGRGLNPQWQHAGDRLAATKWQLQRERDGALAAAAGPDEEARSEVNRRYRRRLAEEVERARRDLRSEWLAAPRRRLVVSASALLTGASREAVGVESFFRQRVERSGEQPTLTPRLGVEGEPVAAWLQLRAGCYLEPSRYLGGEPRLHGTAGFDLKVLPWTIFGLFPDETWWALGGFVDGARDYYSAGARIGVWR